MDKLYLTPNLKEIDLTPEVKLKLCPEKKNPFYNFSFEVYLKGKAIGNYYFDHRKKLRYGIEHPSLLTIHNHVLYASGLHVKIHSILKALELQFYRYYYIEIAIDGYALLDIQNKLLHSKAYHRKQLLRGITPTLNERTMTYKSHTLGSRFSDKYIVIYDKQEEIEKSGKTYIADFWRKNGLQINPDKRINRIEIRLKRKAVNNITSDFKKLTNPEYLASLFRTYGGHYLEYIHNADRKKRRKFVIDWKSLSALRLKKTSKIAEAIPIGAYKHVIKKLYLEYHLTGKDFYRQSYEELAETYQLKHWMFSKFPRWKQELRI